MSAFSETAFKPQDAGVTWCKAVATVYFPNAAAGSEVPCCLMEGHENDHVNICGSRDNVPPVSIETRWRDEASHRPGVTTPDQSTTQADV